MAAPPGARPRTRDQDQFSGPFINVLQQPALPPGTTRPSGYMGDAGAVAMMGSKFLQGFAQGRVQAEAKKHLRSVQALDQFERTFGSMPLDQMTPEAQAEAARIRASAVGALNLAGNEKQFKKLGKKAGDNPELAATVQAMEQAIIRDEEGNPRDIGWHYAQLNELRGQTQSAALQSAVEDASDYLAEMHENLGRKPTQNEILTDRGFQDIRFKIEKMGGNAGALLAGYDQEQRLTPDQLRWFQLTGYDPEAWRKEGRLTTGRQLPPGVNSDDQSDPELGRGPAPRSSVIPNHAADEGISESASSFTIGPAPAVAESPQTTSTPPGGRNPLGYAQREALGLQQRVLENFYDASTNKFVGRLEYDPVDGRYYLPATNDNVPLPMDEQGMPRWFSVPATSSRVPQQKDISGTYKLDNQGRMAFLPNTLPLGATHARPIPAGVNTEEGFVPFTQPVPQAPLDPNVKYDRGIVTKNRDYVYRALGTAARSAGDALFQTMDDERLWKIKDEINNQLTPVTINSYWDTRTEEGRNSMARQVDQLARSDATLGSEQITRLQEQYEEAKKPEEKLELAKQMQDVVGGVTKNQSEFDAILRNHGIQPGQRALDLAAQAWDTQGELFRRISPRGGKFAPYPVWIRNFEKQAGRNATFADVYRAVTNGDLRWEPRATIEAYLEGQGAPPPQAGRESPPGNAWVNFVGQTMSLATRGK